jgi:hypothetical protein
MHCPSWVSVCVLHCTFLQVPLPYRLFSVSVFFASLPVSDAIWIFFASRWWLSYKHNCWFPCPCCITTTGSPWRCMTCALCRCNHWDSHSTWSYYSWGRLRMHNNVCVSILMWPFKEILDVTSGPRGSMTLPCFHIHTWESVRGVIMSPWPSVILSFCCWTAPGLFVHTHLLDTYSLITACSTKLSS